jgi:hypothetical protein
MKSLSHPSEWFDAITTRDEENYHLKNSPKKEGTRIA